MATPGGVHDPLFHFETHFPERLSRLHLNPDLPSHVAGGGRRNKRSRASRQGGRYKTQPVTFDEIQEVDEENIKEEDKTDGGSLKGQFQAFSRSMDGLVPKQSSSSRVRKGSIPECPDLERISEITIKVSESLPTDQNGPELRLEAREDRNEGKENKENEPFENEPSVTSLPQSGPQVQSRRPRQTAKAKKRQMAADGTGGGGAAGNNT